MSSAKFYFIATRLLFRLQYRKQCFFCAAVVQDFCQWQTFNGTCPTGSVIVIEHALYGRMRFNRCLDRSYGHVGCSTSVQRYLESRCAGRRTCLLKLPDQYLDKVATSCPSDLKAYLELSYHCLQGNSCVPSSGGVTFRQKLVVHTVGDLCNDNIPFSFYFCFPL